MHRWDVAATRQRLLFWQRLNPAQLFVGSFAMLIVLGTIGLKLLPGIYTGERLSWLDAVTTSTSAVCVTGLLLQDTGTYFTTFGQAYILFLVQLGGLGMLTFTSFVLIAIGGRLSLRQEALSSVSPLDMGQPVEPRKLLTDVLRFTFAFELAGAIALYCLWAPSLGWVEAVWPAVFHSVSAFCNAGFSTYPDNLMSFQSSPLTLALMSILIVSGGLGFLALEEMMLRFRAGRTNRVFRLSLHTKLVLITTAALLLSGTMIYSIFEWQYSLRHLDHGDRVANAWFASVTARTSGFNSVDYSTMTESGKFFTILLMTIGGSPGGTSGGIKTTTFALLLLLAWSRFRGQEIASTLGRSLRKETTDRAVGLFVVTFTILTLGILFLTYTEHDDPHATFLDRMFLAVAAFTTAGLTTGDTSNISLPGRMLIISLMFLGRVGPLAIVTAFAVSHSPFGSRFRYAYEDVAIG